MSDMEANPSPFVLQALDNHIVLEKIISHLGDSPLDLIKYRSVCHKWNDIIVRKINKSGQSFQIPLRYGPEVPKSIVQSDAQQWGREIMENVINTLTGSATRIHFNSLVVDQDFYLAGINSQWTQFLEIHGEFIQHLKFKIRREIFPKTTGNHVSDCETLVSMENLRSIFFSTPNLETLDFCIRFSHFGLRTSPIRQRMFLDGNIPQLKKLAKITIQEPHNFSYPLAFLIDILSMAPRLTSLYIKPTKAMLTFCRAMKSLENQLKGSLTSFRLCGSHFLGSGLPYLRLTTLEINKTNDFEGQDFVDEFLRAHHSSLVKVILGKRRNIGQMGPGHSVNDQFNYVLNFIVTQLTFPPVMENLKSLEINLDQFKLPHVDSYKIQFPVLERLTLNVRGGEDDIGSSVSVMLAIQPSDGPSQTLKEFYVFSRQHGIRGKDILSRAAMKTFPTAVHHIGENLNV